MYNIYAEKYIIESQRGGSKYFDLPLNTDKDTAIVFISSSTNADLDKIEISHTVILNLNYLGVNPIPWRGQAICCKSSFPLDLLCYP